MDASEFSLIRIGYSNTGWITIASYPMIIPNTALFLEW